MPADQKTPARSGNQSKQSPQNAKKRTHIGSKKLEADPVSTSIAQKIPERWRDPLAILLIFISLIFFFRGALDSTHVLNAGDNVASDSFRPFIDKSVEQGDKVPQWIPNIFAGMPAFAGLVTTGQRTYDIVHQLFDFVRSIPQSVSPNVDAMAHIWHYFLFGLGMYLLLRVTRNTSRTVAFFGAFSAIFSTWIITYVMIGHNTKIFAVMTMPYLFMGIEKLRTPKMRWQSIVFWAAVLALAAHFLLESIHMQMVFYIFLAILLYFITSLVMELVRKHNLIPLLRSGVIALFMVGIAFAMSADRYLSTLGYEPYSIRGVPPIVDTRATPGETKKVSANDATTSSGGLDWNYATAWSFSPQEVITFIVPGWYGFGKMPFTGPEAQREGERVDTYWGQMNGTDAANYTGIVVFALAIIGIFSLWKRDRLVAPLTVISLFALFLSFGGNWPILFRPMFNFFPSFNKFRAPMMALVLMQLCFPIIAALTFEEVLRVWKLRDPKEDSRLQKFFKYGMYAFGALLVAFVVGRGAIESSVRDGIARSGKQIAQYPDSIKNIAVDAAANDALICMLFGAAACALVYFFLKRNKISPLMLGVGLVALTAIDLWRVDNRPLDIIPKEEYQSNFTQHDYVSFIQRDHSLYRVLDMNEPTSNIPVSWGFQTPAGYHAAKMREYQDVVDVTGNANGNVIYNPFMWNLLNTKYIIANGAVSDDQSRFTPVFQSSEAPTEQGGNKQRTLVWENPQVLPRVFLVNRFEIKPKLDILHAMHDGTFNPRDVVYFDEQPKGLPALDPSPVDTAHESATIDNEGYRNEEVTVHTRTNGDRLVFMSDTWYPDWSATVDGKETPIYRANYAFRAIHVSKGDHTLKLTFYDPKYVEGRSISLMSNILVLIGLVIGSSSIYFVRKRRKPEVEIIPPESKNV